jgi:predicted alpha/beta hydrolase family esterase
MGISLGANVSSLAATIEDRLTFCALLIPFASFAELARDRGTLGDNDADFEEFLARREAERSISPLARPPLVKHALVIGAKADQVTPVRHAQMLAHHFNADLHMLEGGHIVQTWRRQGLALCEQWLSTFL